MDKQLLKALDNIGDSLEALVEALKNKQESKSEVGEAMQSGDFGKSLEQITVEIKSIKTDTQEILKNQKTLIALANKKETEKKTGDSKDPIADSGDPKKAGALKKGLATILLIAVAVLAIGMAFKIVGKVNILSVIALGIGIVLVSVAFERVAKIKNATGGQLTIKEAAIISGVMVIMSLATMLSSKILSKISPISIKQALTAGVIALLFVLIAPSIGNMISALMSPQTVHYKGMTTKSTKLDMKKLLVGLIVTPLIMITSSIGIMFSSKILSQVVPISFTQIITIALIAIMFAVVAKGIAGLISAFIRPSSSKKMGGFKSAAIGFAKIIGMVIALPLIMVAIAIGITLSSKALKMITPISFGQALTAILIAAMFAVVSMGIAKLIDSLKKVSMKTVIILPIALVAIALSIALSALIFATFRSSFDKLTWATIGKILLLGLSISLISLAMSFTIKVMGNIDLKKVLLLPVFLAMIAGAVAIAAFIFGQEKIITSLAKLSWESIGKLAVIGIAMAIITLGVSLAIKIVGNITLKKVILLPLLFALISLAVAAATYVFGQDKVIQSLQKITFMTIFKIALIGIAMAIVTIIAAFAIKIMGNISLKKVILLPILFTLISLAVAVSSWIFAKFSKSFNKLTFSTIFRIIFFGIAIAIVAIAMAFAIKIVTKLVKPVDALKGGLVIVILAGVIALTSLILSLGKYNKYPSLKWVLNVGLALTTFGVGALALGSAVFGPQALVFLAGLGAIMLVAAAVVGADAILSGGKFRKYPSVGWVSGVALALGAFTAGIIILGINVINPFFYAGFPLLKKVARSIVDIDSILSKGKYNASFGQWAAGVVLLYATFTPIILILGAVAIAGKISGFFGGPDPFKEGQKMLLTVAYSILAVDRILAKGNYKGGPPKSWAEGVSLAIGAFGPVYAMLVKAAVFKAFGASGVSPKDFVKAIKITSQGIVAAAAFFAKNKAVFKDGPPKKWAEGVGLAIGAFAPVFKTLSEGGGWFTSGKDAVEDMIWGILAVTRAIVGSGRILSNSKIQFTNYPSRKWGTGIKEAIESFVGIFEMLDKKGLSTAYFAYLSSGVASAAVSMAIVASAFYKNRKAFGFTISINWIKGVKTNILEFAKLALELNKMLVSEKTVTTEASVGFGLAKVSLSKTVKVRKDLSLPKDIAIQMANVAQILWHNKKFFSYSLPSNWMKRVKVSILEFAKLALELNKMLVSEKTVTTEASVGFGLAKVSLSKTVKVRKDLSLPKDIAIQMANVAQILWHNKKFFSYSLPSEWVTNLSKNLLRYFFLQKQLESLSGESKLKSALMIGLTAVNPLLGLGFAGASALMESRSDDTVAKAAKKLVKVAWIMYSGRKAFDMKIDPNFMAKVGKNLIDFAYVVKKIAEIERSNSGGNFLRDLTGNDPISSYSKKMIKLAKGYDAMANALLKLGKAIKILKLKDLKELASITSEVSTGKYDPEKRISPVKTKDLFTPKKRPDESRDYTAKFEDLIAEMRLAVRLLSGIKADSKNINRYLAELGNEPKEAEGDSGVRRDRWGRPSTSKWFGFNEKTKKWE